MHANGIELRRVTVAEREQVQKVGRQTFYETFVDYNTKEDMDNYLNEAFNIDKVTEEIENPNSTLYLAVENETILGYMKINTGDAQTELRDPEALELQRIYVLKDHQRKKVGQLLFGKAFEIAKEAGYKYIWLGVWEKNPNALAFYQKNGFVEFSKHVFKLGEDIQTDIMMKLEL